MLICRHLGNAQFKQTPSGRGFEEFIGMFMWDCDYYTKQMFEEAWNPLGIDWVQTNVNGSLHHFAEDRHSTTAITENAIMMMKTHANREALKEIDARDPLFLYVAFTAAHSPLQPLPHHEAQ